MPLTTVLSEYSTQSAHNRMMKMRLLAALYCSATANIRPISTNSAVKRDYETVLNQKVAN